MNIGLTHKEVDISTGRQLNSVPGGVAFKSVSHIEERREGWSKYNVFKGDDRSFSKWLPWNCYFGYTVSITIFYVGLWHNMCIYQYMSAFTWK